MKRLKYIILLLIVGFGAGLYIYNVSDINTMASVHDNITSPRSSGCLGSFHADKDTVVTVSYSSDVQDGTLQLCIKNSNGDIVNKFPVNSKSSEKVTFNSNDNYSLSAQYVDYIGHFDVKIRK